MSLPGFKYLKSYQLSAVIYDLTIEFARRWVDRKSRTKDQMEQAARSGKQNIAEGYLEKSLKGYIYLLGIARASLGELLEDYEDFARQNRILVWPAEKTKADIRVTGVIREIRERSTPYNPYIPNLPSDQETAVNLMLTLINQTCFLMDRQISALEEKFIREGGYTEKLFKRRLEQRGKS